MNGYFYPKKDANDQRYEIQSALDEAKRLGRGTVIIEGDFQVDGTLYISDYTTLVIKNGSLSAKDKSVPLIKNSNCLLPRTRTLFGTQKGIYILGEENAVISGMIELTNLQDFTVKGINFKDAETAISTAYISAGRFDTLAFDNVKSCIKCEIGTRNSYFMDITCNGESESISFSSDRIEGRVVYYYGPDVKNNLIRGLKASTAVTVNGEYCKDIVIV